MKGKGALVLGVIWGIFSLLYSVIVILVSFGMTFFGKFSHLAVCLANSIDAGTFSIGAYAIAFGGLVLAVLGIVGAKISRKQNILGGIFFLGSVAGVFLLYYLPFLFSDVGVIINMGDAFDAAMAELVVIGFLALLVTILGVIGSILAFASGRAKTAAAGYSAYGQPYGQPQYGRQQYQQPQQQYQQPQQQYQPPYAQQPQYGQQQYQQPYAQQPQYGQPQYGQQQYQQPQQQYQQYRQPQYQPPVQPQYQQPQQQPPVQPEAQPAAHAEAPVAAESAVPEAMPNDTTNIAE